MHSFHEVAPKLRVSFDDFEISSFPLKSEFSKEFPKSDYAEEAETIEFFILHLDN